MKKISFLLLLAALSVTSCQNDGDKQSTVKKNPNSIVNLPPLPQEARMELYRKTVSIDIIAYHMGVSMSYNDPSAVEPVLAMVKPEQGVWLKQCKPVGRISFMYENGVGQEAEMLIHNGCKTLVWLKDGKNAYMNELTDDGLRFFNQYMPENPKDLKLPENAQPKEH